MASIHIDRAIALARHKGAAAGMSINAALWEMPKRELVEIVLHLAALCADGEYDTAIGGDGALRRVLQERDAEPHRHVRARARDDQVHEVRARALEPDVELLALQKLEQMRLGEQPAIRPKVGAVADGRLEAEVVG